MSIIKEYDKSERPVHLQIVSLFYLTYLEALDGYYKYFSNYGKN